MVAAAVDPAREPRRRCRRRRRAAGRRCGCDRAWRGSASGRSWPAYGSRSGVAPPIAPGRRVRRPSAPWRWAAWARAISRARSATGTTFWVPAGRSRSWTSPSASSSPTMTAKWAAPSAAASSCLPSLRGRARRAPRARAARRSVAIRRRVTVSSGSAPTTTASRRGLRRDVAAPCSSSARTRRSRPSPNPMPGRRAPAEQLDEPVVAAAAAERLLLALAARDVELERGPRVVVEAANEPGLQPVRHAQGVEVARGRSRSASAQASHSWSVIVRRAGVDRRHRRVLGVEQAQDVALQAVALERRQLRRRARGSRRSARRRRPAGRPRRRSS